MYKNFAQYETIRSADTTAIGASYATIGGASAGPIISAIFKNATNGDVFVSVDGTNNHLLIPANSYDAWDYQTNHLQFQESNAPLPTGTQFSVKDGPTAGSSGTFYIEVLIVKQVGS